MAGTQAALVGMRPPWLGRGHGRRAGGDGAGVGARRRGAHSRCPLLQGGLPADLPFEGPFSPWRAVSSAQREAGVETSSLYCALLRIQPRIVSCWRPMRRAFKAYDEGGTGLVDVADFRKVSDLGRGPWSPPQARYEPLPQTPPPRAARVIKAVVRAPHPQTPGSPPCGLPDPWGHSSLPTSEPSCPRPLRGTQGLRLPRRTHRAEQKHGGAKARSQLWALRGAPCPQLPCMRWPAHPHRRGWLSSVPYRV